MSASSIPPVLDPLRTEAAEAQHKVDAFETALELRRQARGAIVAGKTESTTTHGTEAAPSIVEREGSK